MVATVERKLELGTRMGLGARAVLLALVLASEKLPLDFLVNVNAAEHTQGLGALVLYGQRYCFLFAVALAGTLVLFAYARGDREGWISLSHAVRGFRVHWSRVALHLLMVLSLVPLSYYLYGRTNTPLPFPAIVGLWIMCAAVAVIALAWALAPWQAWWAAARRLGALWLYAAAAAALATSAVRLNEHLWTSTSALTFDAVRYLLAPIMPALQADPQARILSGSRFAVQISDYCSGLEGIGMLLAFCGAWLLCFRKEYRFPRALLLLPIGVLLSFALNAVRIAALLLIGDSGHPEIAAFGFHSQAGWIAFICAAGLIGIGSLHSGWLTRKAVPGSFRGPQEPPGSLTLGPALTEHAERAPNPTAVYLLPLVAAVAAGILARAVSSGFETLYVLRPIAAAVALGWGWRWLRRLDWRCSWRGPLAGILAFLPWIFLAHLLVSTHAGMPAALKAMSLPIRFSWLGLWALAFMTLVPLTQELAFRGYLMRRIAGPDFDTQRFGALGATALIVSAVAFGVEQGALWMPATLAGVIYGVLLIRTERFGEVVAAHAVTNGLLAVAVLGVGQWSLWQLN